MGLISKLSFAQVVWKQRNSEENEENGENEENPCLWIINIIAMNQFLFFHRRIKLQFPISHASTNKVENVHMLLE